MSAVPARVTAASAGSGSRPPDLRLVPAALTTWMVVLLGLYTGPAGGVVAGGLAGGALIAAFRSSRRSAPSPQWSLRRRAVRWRRAWSSRRTRWRCTRTRCAPPPNEGPLPP